MDQGGKFKKAKLSLCDLAGSEKISKEDDLSNDHLKELKTINLSLMMLGKVIASLSKKSKFVGYRESKLTRLLQDSLGGSTKTCIIATISPTA
jgi:kinesin family protein 11